MATTKSHRLQEEANGTAGSRLVYTQSEDNIYEDIICMCLCFWGMHSLYLRVANLLGGRKEDENALRPFPDL